MVYLAFIDKSPAYLNGVWSIYNLIEYEEIFVIFIV